MKKLLTLSAFALIHYYAASQGCIPMRNIAGFGQYNLADNAFSTSRWQLNITSRYFKSHRDYKGASDQKTAEQNKSIVHSFTTDISISRMMSDGWSVYLSVPISANKREASLEHGGPNTTRRTTESFGLNDIRLTVYKWLFRPTVRQKANVQLGLGIKFPTGDYEYEDFYYRNDSVKVLAPVNPSIQLGDGGTGLITELNFFYYLNRAGTISAYANLYYLINPREQNGVSVTAGRVPPRLDSLAGNIVMSVPDQYSLRGGVNANIDNWAFSLGIRHEGSPVNDLLGGSEGVRRAGHNTSVEPGVIFKMKAMSLFTYVPVTVHREIRQNVPDLHKTALLGSPFVSAGGSADYQVFVGALFKL